MTRTAIIYAVNKRAKFTKFPGKVHFDVLIHILWYLRDKTFLGIRFYNSLSESPITKMLMVEIISYQHLFFGFSDSSWNNGIDTGCTTGCFITTYV
jgi:hypothetical protein